jgi:hypothetical protein
MQSRDPPYGAILTCAIGLVVFAVGAFFLAESFFLYAAAQWYDGNLLGFWGFLMMPVGLIVAGASAWVARRTRVEDPYALPTSTSGPAPAR